MLGHLFHTRCVSPPNTHKHAHTHYVLLVPGHRKWGWYRVDTEGLLFVSLIKMSKMSTRYDYTVGITQKIAFMKKRNVANGIFKQWDWIRERKNIFQAQEQWFCTLSEIIIYAEMLMKNIMHIHTFHIRCFLKYSVVYCTFKGDTIPLIRCSSFPASAFSTINIKYKKNLLCVWMTS